jgi:hypothetical protein
MVLQRLEGLSDREAVERFTFDARWRDAAGVGGYDNGNRERFAHTVLVDMWARLAACDKPRRIFDVTVEAASEAGLVGAKRALGTTPLYDAVATADTMTLVRSALRGLLRAADEHLEAELRAVLASGDDYATSAKPHIDWDDADACEALIDSRAREAFACLALLDGSELGPAVAEAAQLLAAVVGQDLGETGDGTFRTARKVARDRVIPTVDPEARHGHKTVHRGFDGYKGHVAADPDSEIITATAVAPGNAGDATVAEGLIADLTDDGLDACDATSEGGATEAGTRAGATTSPRRAPKEARRGRRSTNKLPAPVARTRRAEAREANRRARRQRREQAAGQGLEPPTVYGDSAYGTGESVAHLADSGITSRCKAQAPVNSGGFFTKDRFTMDLERGTVTCPAGVTVEARRHADGGGLAYFAGACATCPLRAGCTSAREGRTIGVSRHEQHLAEARAAQRGPEWAADYRATRPKVERRLGHLMRRNHGGRRGRVRGKRKVDADFNLLAAAQNLARLAGLGLRSTRDGWAVAVA